VLTDAVDLPAVAREVEQYVAAAGWDQPIQLFALVATDELLRRQPDLADQLDPASPLTPIAQDSLPDGDLAAALAGIVWPEVVLGCALVQEIVVLPPGAEQDLPDGDEAAQRVAADHPLRREARLVAAVLRDGPGACLLRLRADSAGNADNAAAVSADGPELGDLVEAPDLAPNLVAALAETLRD
jgi:hypothetical protein